MDFVKLTPAQRQTFDENGFLIVRRALDDEALAGLREAADELLVSFMREPENRYLDLRRGILEEEAIAGLVAHPATVSLVVQLLSPNIHLLSTALICKKPEPAGTSPRRGWHRDLRMPKDCGHRSLPLIGIKVCYCLTEFPGPDTGITKLIGKSHLMSEPLRIPKGEVDPPEGEVIDAVMNAGDAILFDNRTFHSKAPNLGASMSTVLMFGYAYRWLKPEAYLDIPDERLLAKADPVTRQLLGSYRDVDAAPRALLRWAELHGVKPEGVPWSVDEQGLALPPILTSSNGGSAI